MRPPTLTVISVTLAHRHTHSSRGLHQILDNCCVQQQAGESFQDEKGGKMTATYLANKEHGKVKTEKQVAHMSMSSRCYSVWKVSQPFL